MAVTHDVPIVAVLVQILVVWLAVLVVHKLGTTALRRLAAPFPLSRKLIDYGNHAGRLAVFLLVLQIVLRNDTEPAAVLSVIRQFVSLGLIAALTWLAVRSIAAIADTMIELHPADTADNLHARKIQTQTRVLARSAMAVLVIAGAGLALATLPQLRQIGTSLLASAGLVGLAAGLAARPVLSNLLAGLQLALTQPIRLEDVVVVEGEWGWVEEITSTYVVVRIWDQRRMIVPLQWFIEHPFQNWTRTSAEIFGSVLLKVDYRLPVDPLREEALRICQSSPEWDGKMCQVQAVNTDAQALQLRVLVSSMDAKSNWDLCCKVREHLMGFIARDDSQYPPK
ncbi:MAG: mechanosensitive ion channel family protein [Burkholderiales bacterium]|nr:mechanosensitive ion channel family protein [Burkholderiales bacterium]